MINWELINNKSFEKLAFEYMSDKYPELKWVSTKETRDGNRDGETKQVVALDVTLKYWYEAKYSKSFDGQHKYFLQQYIFLKHHCLTPNDIFYFLFHQEPLLNSNIP